MFEPEPILADRALEPVVPEFTKPAAIAKPVEQASLSELMLRLEHALDKRASEGNAASDAPLAGNIASLHELIGLQRKSVL